jgi:hypothetical protein
LFVVSAFRFTGLLGLAQQLFSNPAFWLTLISVGLAAMLPVLAFKYTRFNYNPFLYQIL